MRVDAFLTLPLTAEYWDYTTAQDPISGGTVNTYFFKETIDILVTEQAGEPMLYTRELLRFNAQLRNIVDRGGTPLFGENEFRAVYLGTRVSQFDVFGNIVGYKHLMTIGPIVS